jgi:hypothetical protein
MFVWVKRNGKMSFEFAFERINKIVILIGLRSHPIRTTISHLFICFSFQIAIKFNSYD